tara:strand:+ start:375 stop:2033 length:1659 start_codon:yes stop_codon:yes gene_type:complete
MSFPRRLLIYIVLFVTLNVYAVGFASLIGWVLDLIGIIGDAQTQNIAPFLAAIIVCFPIWLFVWRYVNKGLADSPSEEASTMRNLYLNLVVGLSTIYLSVSIFEFVESIIRLESSLSSIPNLIVWAPLFYVHLSYAQKDWAEVPRKRIHEFYLNITFIISLIIIFISSRALILDVLDYFILLISSNDVLVGNTDNLDIEVSQISALITAGGLWFYSWNLRIKKLDLNFRTIDLSVITVSQAFIFLLSLFFILAQAIILVFDIGNDQSQSLYQTLEFLPQILSFSIVSILIWLYYSSGFLNTGMRKFYTIDPTLIKWTFRYSVRAIALILLISSSVSLLVFLIGVPITLSEEVLIASEKKWELDLISASISAFLIGAMVLRYINYRIKSDSEVSRKKDIEKSYIYIVAVFFLFFFIGALIAILTIIIRDLIAWSWSLSTIELLRWPLSFSLNSILVLWFYRKDIISRFKSSDDIKIESRSLDVMSVSSLEKLKDNLPENLKIKSWKSVDILGEYKSSKKSLNQLSEDLSLIKKNTDIFIVESESGDLAVYYKK